MLRAHLETLPPPIPGLPEPLWTLLSAMLEKDAAGRPSAATAAQAMRGLSAEVARLPRLAPMAAPDLDTRTRVRSADMPAFAQVADDLDDGRTRARILPPPAVPASLVPPTGYAPTPTPAPAAGQSAVVRRIGPIEGRATMSETWTRKRRRRRRAFAGIGAVVALLLLAVGVAVAAPFGGDEPTPIASSGTSSTDTVTSIVSVPDTTPAVALEPGSTVTSTSAVDPGPPSPPQLQVVALGPRADVTIIGGGGTVPAASYVLFRNGTQVASMPASKNTLTVDLPIGVEHVFAAHAVSASGAQSALAEAGTPVTGRGKPIATFVGKGTDSSFVFTWAVDARASEVTIDLDGAVDRELNGSSTEDASCGARKDRVLRIAYSWDGKAQEPILLKAYASTGACPSTSLTPKPTTPTPTTAA